MRQLMFLQFFRKSFPKNLLLRKPFAGSLFFVAVIFGFTIIYRPLGSHESMGLSYTATMAIYSVVIWICLYAMVKVLGVTDYFSKDGNWNFLKEIVLALVSLSGLGLVVYFAAFLFEPPADRWNIATFLHSFSNAFLLGMVPFFLMTLTNISHLFYKDGYQQRLYQQPGQVSGQTENPIQLSSLLKKEKLRFYPSQFLFAEADGNYIVFHLLTEEGIKKKSIRNSMGNIEQQLSEFPFFFKTHRAFIVNLRKVVEKKGNASAYQIRLKGCNKALPVSRQNTKMFDQLLDELAL